jgi:hypothetical protein
MTFIVKGKGQDADQGYSYRIQCIQQPGAQGIAVNGQFQILSKTATIPQFETLDAAFTLAQLAAILEPAA